MKVKVRIGNRIISILLVLVMISGLLPALTAGASAQTSNEINETGKAEDWGADGIPENGISALSVNLLANAYELGTDETIVYSESEFKTALGNAAYTTIYFGANIQLTSIVTVAQRKSGTLIINGTNPKTGVRYQYKDRSASNGTQSQIALNMNSGMTETVIFKDIDLYIQNQYGCIYTTDANSAGRTVIFDNVYAEAAELIYLARGTMVLRDTRVEIYPTGTASSQEVCDIGAIVFEGSVSVKHNSTMLYGYSMFNFPLSASAGTILVKSGADVTLQSTSNGYGCFHFYSSNSSFTIEENANFTYYGRDRFSKGDGFGKFNSFTVGAGSTVTLIMPENNTQSLTPGFLYSDAVTINKGASLRIFANTNSYYPLRTSTLTLNNPKQVVLYNAGSNNLMQSATTIAATGLKSIRYYSTAGDSYNFSTYAYNAGRAGYARWFYQPEGKFNITAANWGASTATINTNNYAGPDTAMTGANLGSNNMRVIQIDGSYSSPPTVNNVAEGVTTITGTGIPGAAITVKSDSTGELTATVGEDGTWTASSATPFVRDETVSVTQTEILYGWPCDTSEAATTVVLRKAVNLIPENNTVKTYSSDNLNVGINKMGATAFTISSVEYLIFDDPDAVSGAGFNPEDSTLFDDSFEAASDGKSGEISYFSQGGVSDFTGFVETITYNCSVWVRAKLIIDGYEVEAFDTISYKNLFTRYPISVRGVIAGSDPADELYGYEVLAGDYGIPYMGDGQTILSNPAGGYDIVDIKIKDSLKDYWTATLDGENTPYPITLDGDFFTNELCDNDDPSLYTLDCVKVPEMWWNIVVVYYITEAGAALEIGDSLQGTISVPLTERDGAASKDFYELGGRYTPPIEGDEQPVGWFVHAAYSDDFDSEWINYLSDFNSSGFDPEFTNVTTENLYIVYKTGQFSVVEYYHDENNKAITNSKTSTYDKADPLDFNGEVKRISGYVPVGYTVAGSRDDTSYTFNFNDVQSGTLPTANQYHIFPALSILGANLVPEEGNGPVVITYVYAVDHDNNGIADNEEATVTVKWHGYTLDSAFPVTIKPDQKLTGRTGYDLTVLNTYPATGVSGDDSHKITFGGKDWLFDSDINASARSITLSQATPLEAVFIYGISSDGETLDKTQYVLEDFYLLDTGDDDDTGEGNKIAGQVTKKHYVLNGGLYSKTPPEITGFIYVGYRIEDEAGNPIDANGEQIDSGETINNITYSNGESPEKLNIIINSARYKVVYLYREAAEPVTVDWIGTTYAGSTMTLGTVVKRGYLGEEVVIHDFDYNAGESWKLTGAYILNNGEWAIQSGSELTFTLGADTQSGRFAYKEASNDVAITINYLSDDGNINFTFRSDTIVTGNPVSVMAISLSGYNMTGWTLTDSQDNEIDSGDASNLPQELDPKNGSQSLTILYECTLTSLYIRCYDSETDTEIEGTVQKIDNISVGETYYVRAPIIEGYALDDEPLTKSATALSGTNTLEFNYKKITGGVLILRENDDTGPIIEYRSLDVSIGTEVSIPDLSGSYYTAISDVVNTYNGDPVTYYYAKQLMDVEIQAVDADDPSTVRNSIRLTNAARKGEMYQAVADITVQGYTLSDSVSKYMYADPAAADNILVVPFTFRKDKVGDVTVEYYYIDAINGRVPLGSFTVSAVVGSKFTTHATDFPGFILKDGEESIKEIIVEETDNLVEFEYTDMRKTVAVYVMLGTSGSPIPYSAEKYPLGTEVTVYPPYQDGYRQIGYTLDGNPETGTGGVTFIVGGDHEIVFNYSSIEDELDEYTSLITVKGVQGSITHYEYQLRVAKNAAAFDIEAFILPGLKVESAMLGVADKGAVSTVEVDPADGNQTVVFTYANNMAYVTIRAYYGDGTNYTTTKVEGFTEYAVSAEIGKPLSVAAPYITGHTCKNPNANILAAVTGSDDEIIFYYTKDTGNLTVNAVEVDAADNDTVIGIIGSFDYALTVFGTTAVPAPAEVDSAIYTIASENTIDVEYDGVTAPASVTFKYVRNTRNVIIQAVNVDSNAVISTGEAQAYGVGKIYDISAPEPAGYTRIGSAAQKILVDSASDEDITVIFYYRQIARGTVKVVAYWNDGTENIEIQSYTQTAQAGTTVDITAPVLHGWSLANGEPAQRSVTATDGVVTVNFKYVKNVSVITVKLMAGVTNITANAPADYETTLEIPNGDNYTVTAPYVNGYVLADTETGTRTGTASGSTVEITFYYQAIEDLFVTHAIRGVEIDDEGHMVREFYSYSFSVRKAATSTEYTAAVVPGYAVGGEETCVLSDSTNGSYTFSYAPNVASVTIVAVDESDNELFSKTVNNVTIGTTYGSIAPHIDGYALDDELYKTITVSDASENTITFSYVVSGKVRVILIETGNNSIIEEISVTIPDTYNAAPALDYYTYDAQTTELGGVLFPLEITDVATPHVYEIFYTKDTRPVVIKAVDVMGTVIDESYTQPDTVGRIGEMYIASAVNVQGYTLTEKPTKLVYVDDVEGTLEIKFVYKEDQAAAVTVTAYYMNGENEVILHQYTFKGIIGSKVKASAFEIPGWQLIDPATEKEITVGTADNEIKFGYGMKMADITIKLADINDSAKDLTAWVVTPGYQFTRSVQTGVALTISAPLVDGYILQGPNYSYSGPYTDGQELIFTYKAIEEVVNEYTVDIAVSGAVISGQKETVLYKYTVPVAKETGGYEIKPFSQAGYVLTKVYVDNVDVTSDTAQWNAGTLTLTVEAENIAIRFEYAALETHVTVKLTDGVSSLGEFKVTAEAYTKFTYHAPAVDGYSYVSNDGDGDTGSIIGSIGSAAVSGGSVLTFTYRRITGDVTLVAKEAGGAVIGLYEVDESDLTLDGTAAYTVPLIDTYTAVTAAIEITWDGGALMAEAYYTKDLVDIPIIMVDDGGANIGTSELTGQRKGEMVTVVAPDVPNYVLVGPSSKRAAADSSPVTFVYREIISGELAVKAVKKDSGELLESYVMTVDSEMTGLAVRAPELLGWVLEDSTSSPAAWDGTSKEIVFIYIEDVVTVTVRATDSSGAELRSETVKAARGGNYTAYAPHIDGYVLDGADKQTLSNLSENKIITFVYKPIEDIVDEYLVNIIVRGVDSSGNQLYSFIVTKTKDPSGIAKTEITALDVNGYELVKNSVDGTDEHTVTVPLDDSVNQVTFTYGSLAAAVTIKAELPNGDPVPDFTDILAPATKGQSFSYNAPYIPGYNLVGAVTQTIGSVGGSDVVTFEYEAASGNVVIILKEENTGGRVIKTQSEEVISGDDLVIEAPDISRDAYTLIGPASHEVSYTGTAQTIEFYYTKDTATVTVEAWDMTNPSEPEMLDSAEYECRVGEAATFNAPNVTGTYKLVSSALQTVIVTAGGDSVIFEYVSTQENEITVKAVNDLTDEILYSYTLTGTKGNSVTVNAPELAGWAVTGAGSKTVTVPGTAEFRYVENTVTVTLRFYDQNNGNAVIPAPSGVVTSFKVAMGMDFTAYAPHIPGYVLKSPQSLSLTNLSANSAAEFYYVPIEDIVDELLVTIYISGETESGTVLYAYDKSAVHYSGTISITANPVSGYALDDVVVDGLALGDDSGSIDVDVSDEDITVVFIYRSLETVVTIYILDEDGYDIIPSFTVPATAGQPLSYNAPDLYRETGIYYYLLRQISDNDDSDSAIGRIDEVEADGSSIIEFYYSQVSGDVIFVAKEDGTNGRIIQIWQIPSAGWLHDEWYEESAPDLSSDYYIYTGYEGDPDDDSGIIEFLYDQEQMPMIIELYYEKETMDIPVIARVRGSGGRIIDEDIYRGARMGEIVYIEAIDLPGYKLADLNVKSVTALSGAEVEFYYTEEVTSGSLTINVTDSATGGVISGANVTITDGMGAVVFSQQTDSGGAAEYSPADFGMYTITVTATGYNGGKATRTISEQQPDGSVHIALGTTAPAENIYTLTIRAGSGGTITRGVSGQYSEGTAVSIGASPNNGYTFNGWTSNNGGTFANASSAGTTFTMPAGNVTITAYFTYTGDNETDKTAKLTVLGVDENGKTLYTDTSSRTVGDIVTVRARDLDGYTLDDNATKKITIASSSSENLITFHYIKDDTGYGAGSKNVTVTGAGSGSDTGGTGTGGSIAEHSAYLTGYADGTVRPDGRITRAEAAMVFYRLMPNTEANLKSSFTDVADDAWYALAVAHLEKSGIITGYPDGTFAPDAYITRAEFTVMVYRFFGVQNLFENMSDVAAGHWAMQYIQSVVSKGWIVGYPDGTFKPENHVTRAEVVTIINRALGRRLLAEDIPLGVTGYTDIDASHWAYASIIEASINHNYGAGPDGYESWTSWR